MCVVFAVISTSWLCEILDDPFRQFNECVRIKSSHLRETPTLSLYPRNNHYHNHVLPYRLVPVGRLWTHVLQIWLKTTPAKTKTTPITVMSTMLSWKFRTCLLAMSLFGAFGTSQLPVVYGKIMIPPVDLSGALSFCVCHVTFLFVFPTKSYQQSTPS